jgi:hypothetical protein
MHKLPRANGFVMFSIWLHNTVGGHHNGSRKVARCSNWMASTLNIIGTSIQGSAGLKRSKCR